MKLRRLAPIACASGVLVVALGLAACAGGSTAPGVPPNASSAGALVAGRDSWGTTLANIPVGAAGCFRASYPSLRWSPVACSTSPLLGLPLRPPRRIAQLSIADQYTAIARGNDRISAAIGSFPQAVVTGEKTVNANGSSGWAGPNSYTLQINTNVFPTAACTGVPNCYVGWVQFVYTNPPNAPGSSSPPKGQLNIWNWLEPEYDAPIRCPSGWKKAKPFCYQVSPTLETDNHAIGGDALVEMALKGTAGATDSAFLVVGSTAYAVKQSRNGLSDLAAHWQSTQFNIYGDDNGSIAQFQPGTAIAVSVQTDFGSGITTAPECAGAYSTTAELNSLNYVAPPSNAANRGYPSILFAESNGSGAGAPSCKSLAGR